MSYRLIAKVPASNPAGFWDSHTVEFGHVLEDTHETRDGWPMSAYLSFLSNTWSVVIDDNEYN